MRAEAAQLLGSMHQVSDSFLFQTLDKKLMSDLKVFIADLDGLMLMCLFHVCYKVSA